MSTQIRQPMMQGMNGQFSNKNLRAMSGSSASSGKMSRPSSAAAIKPLQQTEYQNFIVHKEEALHMLANGKYTEAISRIVSVIETASEFFGKDSQQFQILFNESIQSLCDTANKIQANNLLEKSQEILLACLRLTHPTNYYEKVPEKRILCLNNIGCLYRKMKKLGKARVVFEEAVSLVQAFPNSQHSGMTYMNICAVMSQAGLHNRAIEYARQGLKECLKHMIEYANIKQFQNQQVLRDKVKFAAISYHNLAMEEEFLNDIPSAKENYRLSCSLFEEYQLPLQDPLYLKFQQSYKRCLHQKLNGKGEVTFPKSNSSLGEGKERKFSNTQTPRDQEEEGGFFFKDNKLMSRKSLKSQQSEPRLPENDYPKRMSGKAFFNEGSNDNQSPAQFFGKSNPQSEPKMRGSKSSIQLQQNLKIQKEEIFEMDQIGILDWSDSEKSEEESDAESETTRQNRIDFIKQMQNEVKLATTGLMESHVVPDEKFEEYHSEHTQTKQKSQLEFQEANIQSLSRQGSFSELPHDTGQAMLPKVQQIASLSSLRTPRSFHEQQQQQQVINSQRGSTQLTAEVPIVEKKSTPLVRSMKSQEFDSRRSSILRSQRNSIKSVIIQKQPEQVIKVYTKQEQRASFKIARFFRKAVKIIKAAKRQKYLLQLKEQRQYQIKIQQMTLVLQKFFKQFILRRRAKELIQKQLKEISYKIIASEMENLMMEVDFESSHDRWVFTNEGNKNEYQMFKVIVMIDQTLSNFKIIAIQQDVKKHKKAERYQLIYEISKLLKNPSELAILKCKGKDLRNIQTLRMLACNLGDKLLVVIAQEEGLDFVIEENLPTFTKYSLQEQHVAATKIQIYFKMKKATARVNALKFENLRILKRWTIKIIQEALLLNIQLIQNKRENNYYMLARNFNDKNKYPKLIIEKRYIGFWEKQNEIVDYFDIYYDLIDPSQSQFVLSGLFYKKIGRSKPVEENSEESKGILPSRMQVYKDNIKYVILLQAALRGIAARVMYSVKKESKSKQTSVSSFLKVGEQTYFIGKTGYVYEGREAFMFQLFFSPSQVRQGSLINPTSEDSNFTSVMMVSCISLETKSEYNQVATIKQVMNHFSILCFFDQKFGYKIQKVPQEITMNEVIRFGSAVLKHTKLKLVRDQLKIISPNIQFVMHDQLNQVRKRDEQEQYSNQADSEFFNKLIYNKTTVAVKRQAFKSIVSFCDFDQKSVQETANTEIGNLCQKKIVTAYKDYKQQQRYDVEIAKDVQSIEQLRKKAYLNMPSTEYTEEILNFMNKGSFKLEEEPPVKPEIPNCINIGLDQRCSIGSNDFLIDTYYDETQNCLIIVAQSVENLKIIRQIVVSIDQLAIVEFSKEAVEKNIAEVVFQQLRHKNFAVYFEENKAMKRKLKAAALKELEQKAQVKLSQAQENRNKEKESQLQVFLFTIISDNNLSIDVFFHTSAYKFIMKVSQANVAGQKKDILLMLKWFNCGALEQIVNQKNPFELSTLFYPIFLEILNYLQLSYDSKSQIYSFDLGNAKRHMPSVLQNYFALKLQKQLQMRLQMVRYSFVKKFQTVKECLINTEVCISANNYFEKRWYLNRDQFLLRCYVEKYPKTSSKYSKKVFQINLLELKKIFTTKTATETATPHEFNAAFLYDNNWTDIQGTHSKTYYETTFSELIQYLNQQIHINVVYTNIIVQMLDERIPFKQEKSSNQTKAELEKEKAALAFYQLKIVLSSVLCLQRAYRKFKSSDWMNIKLEYKKRQVDLTKTVGTRLFRTFKKINGKLYFINVYQLNNIYSFDLNLFQERRKPKKGQNLEIIPKTNKKSKNQKDQLRGVYEYEPTQLLNTGSKTLPEFLLDRISVVEDEVIFESINFSEHQPEQYQNVKLVEEVISFKSTYDTFQIQQALADREEGLINPKLQNVSNTVSNLVNYQYQGDKGKSYIYNVIYTGSQPTHETLKNDSILIQKSNEDIGSNQEETSNVVKINVDLNELKKMYPSISGHSQGLMKELGEQLIGGIKVNSDGKVQIDQSRLNPKVIEVEINNVNMAQINKKIEEEAIQQQQMQQQMNQSSMMESLPLNRQLQQQQQQEQASVHENKKILLKQTRFFSKQKYLILIYLIERKVKKIMKTGFDNVFEEYEVLYSISCLNIASKQNDQVIWEVTPEEVLLISEGIKDNMERARFLMRRIQIFNKKIIFTVLKKELINKLRPNPNLIVYYEQGLIPIQNHFRNRRFRRNYLLYKEEMKLSYQKIIHKCIPDELRSLTQYYLMACIDLKESKDKWEIAIWDIVTFERYSKIVNSTEFQNNVIEFGREVTVETIAKFIEIDIPSATLSLSPGVSEYFRKYKEELKRRKIIKDAKLLQQQLQHEEQI